MYYSETIVSGGDNIFIKL